jgi:hypothetical protein
MLEPSSESLKPALIWAYDMAVREEDIAELIAARVDL